MKTLFVFAVLAVLAVGAGCSSAPEDSKDREAAEKAVEVEVGKNGGKLDPTRAVCSSDGEGSWTCCYGTTCCNAYSCN